MRYIKYVKVFMLLAVVSMFAACSDDDVKINSNQGCTVGFANTELTVSEPVGYVSIPINVTGKRNGNVQMTIETAPVGTNGAVEGVNYRITDKTLNLNTDTLSSTSLNLELQVIDDYEENLDRQFTLTITMADGAEVTTSQMTVTIRDNDGNLYERFGGVWTLSATNALTEATITQDIRFTCAEPGGYGYERTISATTTNLLGYNETLKWNFQYSYNEDTHEGTLSFVAGTRIGTISISGTDQEVMWANYVPVTAESGYVTMDPIVGTWNTSDDEKTISPVSFGDSQIVATFDDGSGYYSFVGMFSNITLTRKQ